MINIYSPCLDMNERINHLDGTERKEKENVNFRIIRHRRMFIPISFEYGLKITSPQPFSLNVTYKTKTKLTCKKNR